MADEGHITYSEEPCITKAVPYDAARASVTNSASTSASITRGAGGVFRAAGAVNNTPVNFIVDTGATNTTLSFDAAQKIGIRDCTPAGIAKTGNGSAIFCRVAVSRLTFAGFDFVNVSISVQPAMQGESLLGNDLLKQFTIRQEGNLMTLSR